MSSATGKINDNRINVFQVESQYYLTQLHNTKTNTNKRLGSLASFNFFKQKQNTTSQKGSHLLDIESAVEKGEKNPYMNLESSLFSQIVFFHLAFLH